ncbi:MAG: RDD family protein, partial [Gaiellaceae bacterium]
LIDSLLIWVVVVAVIGIALGVAAANETAGGIVLILAIVFAFAGPIFYTIYWTGKEPGQTIGKKALGIRVRHAEEDRAIGYGPSAGRYLITVVFGFFVIPSVLDYLWPLWDKRNQALDDKVANSIVVRV